MKNVIFILSLFLLGFLISSCSKTPDCDFIGEWCIDYGSGPCIEPFGTEATEPELKIKSNGELIFGGGLFKWDSEDCRMINLTQDGSPEKSVWTITLSEDNLRLDIGVGVGGVIDFVRKK